MKSFFLAFFLFCESPAAKIFLTELVPKCDAKDPNLNSCVVKSANLLIPKLTNGIEELNFPPLDPLRVPEIIVNQDSQPIALKLKLIDTVQTGLSTFKFYSASMDMANDRWILNATLPDFSISGRYEGSGRIILVPINGRGFANFTYSNTKVDFFINGKKNRIGKREGEDGGKVFQLKNLKVHFIFDKCYVSMTDLFGQRNKHLSETVNQFLGNNAKEVMNGLKGSLEKIYSGIYFNLVKKLISNVSYSRLFDNV